MRCASRRKAWVARIFLLCTLGHGVAAVVAWASLRRLALGRALVEVLGLLVLVAATAGTALLVAITLVSVRAVRRRMSYEK